jgi:hypothetical protein
VLIEKLFFEGDEPFVPIQKLLLEGGERLVGC